MREFRSLDFHCHILFSPQSKYFFSVLTSLSSLNQPFICKFFSSSYLPIHSAYFCLPSLSFFDTISLSIINFLLFLVFFPLPNRVKVASYGEPHHGAKNSAPRTPLEKSWMKQTLGFPSGLAPNPIPSLPHSTYGEQLWLLLPQLPLLPPPPQPSAWELNPHLFWQQL